MWLVEDTQHQDSLMWPMTKTYMVAMTICGRLADVWKQKGRGSDDRSWHGFSIVKRVAQ